MKRPFRPAHVFALGAALAVLLSGVRAGADEIKLPWKSGGVTMQVGYYLPVQLMLSREKPAGIKKAPDALDSPLYGEIKLGPAGSPASFFVIMDEPEGKDSRLFVNANGDGDFTGDAPLIWQPAKITESGDLSPYKYGVDLQVPYGLKTLPLHVEMYWFDKHDPQRANAANSIFYFRDYGRAGEITLDGKNYNAILVNDTCDGDFRGGSEKSGRPPRLFIDINGDGKFKMNSESFAIGKPFNVGGVTYEFSDISASGDSFQIVKSSQTVPESTPQVSLAPGRKALPFQARTTDGKEIRFPGSYKGKVVLLDFWATWCGPCRVELPNVVAVYGKFHEKGFDVLSVSLDRENDGQKLAQFTRDHHMPWPQIYDGKYWHAEVAQAYSVDSIPRAFLVDGDSGMILAEGDDVRGAGLTAELEKAFARRNAQ